MFYTQYNRTENYAESEISTHKVMLVETPSAHIDFCTWNLHSTNFSCWEQIQA